MTVVRDGEVTFPPPKISVSAAPTQQKQAAAPVKQEEKKANPAIKYIALASIIAVMLLIGIFAPTSFLPHFTVFVLSCVVGYYVVWNVSHSLHTPLMAVTNAISGIIVVGALVQVAQMNSWVIAILCAVAILIASINIFGGFAVTKRMLKMFRKEDK
jgi:NAD(P) transhydrogenase subunit alpha